MVELLVAFTLLSLIALLLFGALRFGTRVWDKAIERNEAGNQMRIVQHLVRRQLAQSIAKLASKPGTKATDLFQGAREAVTFVAPLPAQLGGGGYYRQTLRADDGEQGLRLLLSWQPVDYDRESREPPGGAEFGSAVLLEDIAGIELAYFDPGNNDREPDWLASWERKQLPPLVRLRLAFQEGSGQAWPELIAPLHLAKGT